MLEGNRPIDSVRRSEIVQAPQTHGILPQRAQDSKPGGDIALDRRFLHATTTSLLALLPSKSCRVALAYQIRELGILVKR